MCYHRRLKKIATTPFLGTVLQRHHSSTVTWSMPLMLSSNSRGGTTTLHPTTRRLPSLQASGQPLEPVAWAPDASASSPSWSWAAPCFALGTPVHPVHRHKRKNKSKHVVPARRSTAEPQQAPGLMACCRYWCKHKKSVPGRFNIYIYHTNTSRVAPKHNAKQQQTAYSEREGSRPSLVETRPAGPISNDVALHNDTQSQPEMKTATATDSNWRTSRHRN